MLLVSCTATIMFFLSSAAPTVEGPADLENPADEGQIKLMSIGAMAFGPNQTLFVSDPMAATLYAVDVSEYADEGFDNEAQVVDIEGTLAGLLGVTTREVRIMDMEVSPTTSQAFIGVMRGSGPEGSPILMVSSADGEFIEVDLKSIKHTKVSLPNPPQSNPSSRRGDPRSQSITDIAFVDDRVIVAGLSNEEFASKLRSVPYPFKEAGVGTSVEVYHGAHGKFETHAPVRTFIPFPIDGKPHLLAAYTCTPLVKFPLEDLMPGSKVQGTTIAELGSGNSPLDMVAYEKEGEGFLLIANSRRGIMKIKTSILGDFEGITERVGGTAGVNYETIENLNGVEQLASLSKTHALALVRSEAGSLALKAIALP